MSTKNIILTIIIFLGIISRLIEHFPNFTPILSICIFSGMMFDKNKKMFMIPLTCMFLSDLLIGIHSTMIFVYVSLFLIIYISNIKSNKFSFISLLSLIFTSNIIFFIITNFGVWFMQVGFYEKSFLGLISCYVAGLPFLNNALLSNLIFAPFLIYSYKYLIKKYPVLVNT